MNRRHTSLEEQKVDKKLFGTRINKARKDRGLTAEKLAEACNINSTYLRQIEGGKKLPSLPVFATLCRELRVSPNYIMPDLVEGTEAEKIQKIFSESDPTPSQIEMLAEMAGVILKER
jgi:transcriptional regulator with XRE-family HTH domain